MKEDKNERIFYFGYGYFILSTTEEIFEKA